MQEEKRGTKTLLEYLHSYFPFLKHGLHESNFEDFNYKGRCMLLLTKDILITHPGYGLRLLDTRCKGGHVTPPVLTFVVLGVKSGSAFERVR